MLDGQGADELLAGYGSYLGAYLAQMLAMGKLGSLGGTAWRVIRGGSATFRMLALRTGAFVVPSTLHLNVRRLVGEPVVPAWLNRSWVNRNVATVVRGDFGVTHRRRALREFMDYQMRIGSLPSLLRYEDRNSVSLGIQARVPFLTTQLAEFVFSLPDSEILGGGVSKSVLRRAMDGIVPGSVLARKDKIGFATPERSWLTGPLAGYVRDVLTSDTARAIPALEPQHLVPTFDRVMRGAERFNFRIWRWINLIEWTRIRQVTWDE